MCVYVRSNCTTMVKAALIKLLLLVILAILICLPEFFKIYTVSKVNFLCHPYQPCSQKTQVEEEKNRRPGSAEDKRRNVCDPFPATDRERWKQISTQKTQSGLSGSEPETQEVRQEPEMSWFTCETDKNMGELHKNITASDLKTYLEVSVELQLNDVKILNLTLYGRSNHSSLHLRLPEEDQAGDDEGQREAFYCCPPAHPTSKSANQSLCLLWLANQTLMTETVEGKLPWKRTDKDEWWCVFRVIWLALLCVVFLIVFIAVIEQVFWGKSKKPKMSHSSSHFNGQQCHDGKKQTCVVTSKGKTHRSYSLQLWSRLPPIQEDESQSDAETLLDGSARCSYTENLHHRDHPSTSVSTEEQQEPHRDHLKTNKPDCITT